MKHKAPIISAAAFALVMALGQPAQASLKGGVEAFLDGDYEQVVLEFKKVLKKKRQPDKVQLIMAHMYLEGLGVEINYSRAYQYLLPSAKKDNAWAQTEIAKLLFAGNGPMQSYQQANEYFRKAAMQGYIEAQLALAHGYLNGLGMTADNVLGYAWLNLAASGSNGVTRDDAISLRELTATEMTPGEITRAQNQSLEWFERIKVVEPEIISMMRQSREKPTGPTTKITITFLGQKFTTTGKSLGIDAALKSTEDQLKDVLTNAVHEAKPAPGNATKPAPGNATKTKPAAKKTAAPEPAPKVAGAKKSDQPAPSASAGQSTGADQPGFVAALFGAIWDALAGGPTGIISGIFNAIFGSDESAPGPAATTEPTSTPTPSVTKPLAPATK